MPPHYALEWQISTPSWEMYGLLALAERGAVSLSRDAANVKRSTYNKQKAMRGLNDITA